jgi:hypothetical protein
MSAIRSLARRGAPLALVAALAACEAVEPSEYVNQTRIHTAYELEYDASRDVTVARATFRFGEGGTLLELSGDSHVTLNDAPMGLVRDPFTRKTYYERSVGGRLMSATFRFEDTEGRRYENSASIRAADFPASGVGTIDNDASHTLFWDGTTLVSGEHVDVGLFRIVGGAALGGFRQSTPGTRSVVLDRGQLQYVSPGSVTLSMTREASLVPAQRPAAGGELTVRYKAVPVSVEIVD